MLLYSNAPCSVCLILVLECVLMSEKFYDMYASKVKAGDLTVHRSGPVKKVIRITSMEDLPKPPWWKFWKFKAYKDQQKGITGSLVGVFGSPGDLCTKEEK